MNDPARALLLSLLPLLGGMVVLLVLALVVVRATSQLRERRARRRRDELRALVLNAVLGLPDEAEAAMRALKAREGRAWRYVEHQVLAMLPKIKGESHDALVDLLRDRGAVDRARRHAEGRSTVRRSRGAHQLGALGQQDAVGVLLALLADRQFLVRRTAVRALGQLKDPVAVTPLLDAVTEDPALVRDVMASLQRMGPDTVPELRRDLEDVVATGTSGRRGALVARVLGLHGDIVAVPLLVRVLTEGYSPSMQAAAAQALGEIGAPSAVAALVGALSHPDPAVQLAAAEALGNVSAVSAVPGLVAALGSGTYEVDRAVAGALAQLGPAGLDALGAHTSPFAREALALHGLAGERV